MKTQGKGGHLLVKEKSTLLIPYTVGTKLPQKPASRTLLPPQLQALAALDMPSVCSHVPRGILLTKDLAPIDPNRPWQYVH